jgi:hypothetical protein
VHSALSAFVAKFPDMDSTKEDYQLLLTNFFNHRFGFSLNYAQYRQFLDSCQNISYGFTLCNQPSTEEIDVSQDNSCMSSLFSTALTNANYTYIAYIDSVHRDFRDAWMTKCLGVQPRLNMTADLYEYHYTLYYYNQSGNLVKTIPPEGVDLLTPEEIVQVQDYRTKDASGSTCYANTNSLVFNPDSDASSYISVSFDPPSGSQFTTEFWVKLSTLDPQQLYAFATTDYYGGASAGADFYWNGNTLSFDVNSVYGGYDYVETVDVTQFMSLNQWIHIVATYDENKTDKRMHIYLNGNELSLGYQNYALSGPIFSGAAFSIYNGVGIVNGSIKHSRLYTRVLGSSEIRQNAFNPCYGPSNTAGLISWTPLTSMDGGDLINQTVTVGMHGVIEEESAVTALVPQHRLPTVYKYNSLDQVIWQRSPDGDTSEFFYDRLGRLIVAQNREQKENASYSGEANRFSYTMYDGLGRITEVGEKSGADDIRSYDVLDTAAISSWTASGTNRQITRTIYDIPVNAGLQEYSSSRKRVTASIYLENSDDAEGDSTIYSYDIMGNVKILVQHIKALVAADPTNGRKRIDYDYDLVSSKVNEVKYQEGKGDQFFYRYSYDADNRVTRSYSSRDRLIWTEDASYTYYLHGPLARTELGQYKVQGIDYAYTLQGWLKGINGDSLDASKEIGGDGYHSSIFARVSRDVYGYKVGYRNGDYAPIDVTNATAFATKSYTAPNTLENAGNQLFNGNISYTMLALSKINSGATKGETYGYDQLNRLVEMRQHATNAGGGWSNSDILTAYQETITYDDNGNILKYLRKGTEATPDMDSLNYNYNLDENGNLVNNRLNHVRDQVSSGNYSVDIDSQSSDNYEYDLIGNLKKDVAEGIDTVRWTAYGKINHIVKYSGAALIDYTYGPGGMRSGKKVNANDTITKTFYVRDAQGNVLSLYTQVGDNSLKWSEQHLYGCSRLGVWNWDASAPVSAPVVNEDPIYDSLMSGSRSYELINHLGNVLSTISDKKIGNDSSGVVNYYSVEVLSQNDFYPGGMQLPERTYQAGSTFYRFGFNSHEKSDEISGAGNHTTALYGEYDTRLVRRWNPDPKPTVGISDYSVFFNNPIWRNDILLDTPTVKEAAYIADHVYGETDSKLLNGWKRVDLQIEGVKYHDDESGYDAGLYQRTVDGKTEYVFATQGTDPTSWKDWKNNIQQPFGASEQYKINAINAEALQKHFGKNADLTFVGHSLGGGLAAEGSMITNHPAITFNAAGLSPITKAEISKSFVSFAKNLASPIFRKIDAYVVNGEILNSSLGPIGLGADGTVHKISVKTFSWYKLDVTGISKHMMGAVKNALENEDIK